MQSDLTERILRGLYSAVLYLLAPVTLYHLIWRGFRQRAYFQRWSERYGSYAQGPDTALWLHAVSVGEVNAAAPLIERLRRDRPDLRLVVTTITPTGSERVLALWGDAVTHVYLPYDLPGAVGRFLDHFRPALALIVETELWPNLLFACRDRGIPTHILNGRLSARSLRGYRALRPLIRRALRSVRLVAAQSAEDGRRFTRLGADPQAVVLTGNLKFDIPPVDNHAFVEAFGARRAASGPVWIAASTHEDEEAAMVGAHLALLRVRPDALLLWAPRHPERFRAVAQRARDAGLSVATRSEDRWPGPGTQVLVIDTLGELTRFYACARVAFVGGSLQPVGGHNLLEPAATGTAILSGPHLHNFADIAKRLREAGAMQVVEGAGALASRLETLFADEGARSAMADNARRLLEEGRGALERTVALIEPALPRK